MDPNHVVGDNYFIERAGEQRYQIIGMTRKLVLLLVFADRSLQLRPYRGKMTADQLTMLEKQYLERHLLESAGLPRLSLFYLR